MANSPDKKKMKNCTELEHFDQLFPQLVRDLAEFRSKDGDISEAMEWFQKVSEYNVPFGKKNRGLTVVQSYQFLVKNWTDKELHISRVIGWCIEWLQAFFLVADDVMDASITRRGKPCWYKNRNVGMEALNDAFYLENAVYILLKKYCKDQSYYIDIVELFHEATMQTVVGQCLDMRASPHQGIDFSRYTIDRYNAIVKWKTAFYSFYLPVACALHMAGIGDASNHDNAKAILLKMGEFFQVQDDYLDCYGDPLITGKIGMDIEDNKCSWLVVQALQRVTPSQKSLLEENYGQNDTEKVAKIKEIYNDLNLVKIYQDYEEESYQNVCQLIENLSGSLPKEMFYSYVKKIYKRQK